MHGSGHSSLRDKWSEPWGWDDDSEPFMGRIKARGKVACSFMSKVFPQEFDY